MLVYLQSILIVGFESPVMRPSGISPHVELFRKLDKNYNSILSLPGIILEGVGKILEEKGIQAGNVTREFLERTVSGAIAGLSALIISQTRNPITATANHDTADSGTSQFQIWSWGVSSIKYQKISSSHELILQLRGDYGFWAIKPRR